MTVPTETDDPLLRYADAIDRQDWPGLRALLDDGFRAELVHDGPTLGADDRLLEVVEVWTDAVRPASG